MLWPALLATGPGRRIIPGMRATPGALRVLALALWTAAVVGVAGSAVVHSLEPAESPIAVLVVVLPSVGVLIAVQRPSHPVGWLLLAASVAAFDVSTLGEIGEQKADGTTAAWPDLLAWIGEWSFVGIVLLAIHVPLRFPDGRLPSTRWRKVERAAHLGTVLMAANQLLAPGPLPQYGVENPVGIEAADPVLALAGALGFLILLLSAAAAVASLVVRAHRAAAEVRKQLRWLLLATCLVVLSVLLLWMNSLVGLSQDTASLIFGLVTLAVYPAAIGVAILRHRALDIDLLIRRSLVYGVLWLAITAVYVAVAVSLGIAAGTRLPVGVAVGLTVAVTIAFAPARRWLESAADRWVFGPSPSPPTMLADLGGALADAGGASDIAASLARTLHHGLRLRWVEARLTGSAPVLVGPADRPEVFTVPISHGAEDFGMLRCGPREDTTGMGPSDTEIITAMAQHAGLALHSAALAGRLVEAQETERRRIERNIHDGAQQQLVAMMARLGIARQRLAGTGAEYTLVSLQDELRAIIDDLRALAQGIHPSVLTDGGLVAAVAQRCDRFPIRIRLDVADGLTQRRLSPEIEGAGYFLVSEALANVLKHAQARSVDLRLGCANGHLEVRISDDGAGFDSGEPRSGGLGALADRLGALGGTLTIDSGGAGTSISARLPLRTGSGGARG